MSHTWPDVLSTLVAGSDLTTEQARWATDEVFAGAATPDWMLVVALLVRGLGLGAVFIPLMAVGFVGLEKDQVPHASIITRIAQQLGGAAGTAVLAVILQGAIATVGLQAAFQQSFWWAVGFTALAVVLSLLLPGRPKPAPASESQQLEEVAA